MNHPDPLTSLRRYLKEPPMDGDYYLFDNYRFHKTAPTAFINSTTQHPYSLEALHFFIQNKDLAHGKYLISCTRAQVMFVSLVDKKDITDYLTGKINTSHSITANPPPIDPSLIACIRPTHDIHLNKRLKIDTYDLNVELDENLQKEKEEKAIRLDGPRVREVGVGDENTTGMSKEQLEELKIKFLKRKLATIPYTIKKVVCLQLLHVHFYRLFARKSLQGS
jgi:hypothetical protein